MDFELFLYSLEAEFETCRREEHDELVGELADAEQVSVHLADWTMQTSGKSITLIPRGSQQLSGTILDATRNWLMICENSGTSLMSLGAVEAAWPLKARCDLGGIRAGLGISSVLRGLATQGSPVITDHDAERRTGIIREVFADHLDLDISPSIHELDYRDRRSSQRITLVTLGIRHVRSLDVLRQDKGQTGYEQGVERTEASGEGRKVFEQNRSCGAHWGRVGAGDCLSRAKLTGGRA